MGWTSNVYRILKEKAVGKSRRRWKDNDKKDLMEISCEDGKPMEVV
jgi:hypothetical protein